MEVFQAVGIDIWLIARYLLLFALGIYVVFAFVVVRQIQLMTDTLEVGFETPIRLLGLMHLLFALAAFALGFLIL